MQIYFQWVVNKCSRCGTEQSIHWLSNIRGLIFLCILMISAYYQFVCWKVTDYLRIRLFTVLCNSIFKLGQNCLWRSHSCGGDGELNEVWSKRRVVQSIDYNLGCLLYSRAKNKTPSNVDFIVQPESTRSADRITLLRWVRSLCLWCGSYLINRTMCLKMPCPIWISDCSRFYCDKDNPSPVHLHSTYVLRSPSYRISPSYSNKKGEHSLVGRLRENMDSI